MNYYNLPKEIDLLIARLKTKATTDEYTSVVTAINTLSPTNWYFLVEQLKEFVVILTLYQASAIDGDLQDILDELTSIKWYNFLQKVTKIKSAIELIETL